jgi:tetratricopeptide (TPR) repeat protein
VKDRFPVRPVVALALGLVASGVVPVWAQPPRTPPSPTTPRTMVQVFGSVDKVVGPEASDELRDRLIRAFPSRLLWVIDKKDIISMLEQSGYPIDEQLPPSDEAQLAKAQRADDYLRGRVTRDGVNLRVEASIVLTRDPSLTQPLPVAEGNRADRAVAPLVKSIQDARKQLPHEKACMTAARDNKFDEALKAADAGIVEYPQATLVRYCKMQVLVRKEAAAAEQVAMAKEILAIDPNSRAALAVAADASQKAGNADEANGYLLRLLAANPGDAVLATRVIDALAASGKLDLAKEVVVKAVAENPGDVDLVELQFKILSASGDLKGAITTGEELIQLDSTRADATFFTRLTALYAADSQATKAVDAAARATTRYPRDAELWQLYAQTLKKAGEGQQSITAARKALEINPKIPNGWTQIAVAYNDLNDPANALEALRQAKAAGDDANQTGAFALSIGNRVYRAAVAEDPKKVESFRAALPFLYFSDSTTTDVQIKGNAKFLVGVSSYYMAQILATGLQASKSCDEAKAAQLATADAMTFTQQGGRTSPEAAAQILNAVNQLSPYIDRQVTTLCKP